MANRTTKEINKMIIICSYW